MTIIFYRLSPRAAKVELTRALRMRAAAHDLIHDFPSISADAGYGDTTAFREALTTAGLAYVVGVKKKTTAWPPGEAPRSPKRWKGRGRPPTHVRRTRETHASEPQAAGRRAPDDGVADGDVA